MVIFRKCNQNSSQRGIYQTLCVPGNDENQSGIATDIKNTDFDIERHLLQELSNVSIPLPVTSAHLLTTLKKSLPDVEISHTLVCNLLNKFSSQKLIR